MTRLTMKKMHKKIIFILSVFAVVMGLALPVQALAMPPLPTPTLPVQPLEPINENRFSQDRSGDRVSFGNNVFVSETVNGDAIAIGGNTTVEQGAYGDVVAILGNATAKGIISGSVIAIGGNATVNGTVYADVVAIGGKVILKRNSIVFGQVVGSQILRDEGTVIKGGIVQTPLPVLKVPWRINKQVGDFGFSRFDNIWFKLGSSLLLFLLVALLLAVYRSGVEHISESVEKDTLRVFIIGLIASMLFIPFVITIIGIPIVLILVLLAKCLGYAGLILFVGRRFLQSINQNEANQYFQALAGVFLIEAVRFIPILGWCIGIVVFLFSLGAMLDSKFGTGRPWFSRA
jgi:hypothetical protein